MNIIKLITNNFENIFLDKDINASVSNGMQRIEITSDKYYVLIS